MCKKFWYPTRRDFLLLLESACRRPTALISRESGLLRDIYFKMYFSPLFFTIDLFPQWPARTRLRETASRAHDSIQQAGDPRREAAQRRSESALPREGPRWQRAAPGWGWVGHGVPRRVTARPALPVRTAARICPGLSRAVKTTEIIRSKG